MSPEHYYNYRSKYGQKSADKRLELDRSLERNRQDQAIVDRKTRGMGCNE